MEAEVLQRMISDYRKKIELYQAMVAEWEKELGISGTIILSATTSENGASNKTNKTSSPSGDLLSLVREWEFFNKSQPEAAKAFLEKVGHPVKTQVILEAIIKGGVTVGGKGDAKDKKMNLYTILHRSSDFGLVAKAKDTWGLAGWPGVTKKDKDGNGDAAEKKEKEAS